MPHSDNSSLEEESLESEPVDKVTDDNSDSDASEGEAASNSNEGDHDDELKCHFSKKRATLGASDGARGCKRTRANPRPPRSTTNY